MSTAAAARPVAGTGLREKTAASLVNSFRLASVTQRLRYHIQDGAKVDPKEFQICCISFAKGIDFAIANNDIPKKVEEFPWLLKQLCRHGTDVYTKTALMVLMISVKVIKRVICRLLLFCE
jgi:E3 SUMO-protein ligase PIAS1